MEQTNAGHAVWVTGISRKANGSFNVTLNDSGTPYGQSEVVRYADFNNAWTDYNHFLCVADNPLTFLCVADNPLTRFEIVVYMF